MNIKRRGYRYHLEGKVVNDKGQQGWEWTRWETDPYGGEELITLRVSFYRESLDEAYRDLVAYDDARRERYRQSVRELLEYAGESSGEMFEEFMEDDTQTQEQLDAITWDREWLRKNETRVVVSDPGCRTRYGYTPEALERLRIARRGKYD